MMGGTHPDRPRPGVLCTAAPLLHDAALVTMHRLSATPWSQPGKPQEPLISQTAVLAPSPPDPTASSPAQLPEPRQPSPLHLGEGDELVTVPSSPHTWPVLT